MIKIAYIGGARRCGTTLLGRVLGQQKGFCFVGELGMIWREGFIENRSCGCGKPFRDCDFWKEVVVAAFGRPTASDIAAISDLSNHVDRLRFLFKNDFRFASRRHLERVSQYRSILSSLYRALALISGQQLIVDSTKLPSRALLLDRVSGLDVRTIHLVRDSRAVAFSWRRAKLRPQLSVWGSALEWNAVNIAWEYSRHLMKNYLRLNYEGFIQNPSASLKTMSSFLDEAINENFATPEEMHFDVQHTISGNPIRFKTGMVQLRLDDEWSHALPSSDRMITVAATFPLMLRYGYFRRTMSSQ